MEDYPPQRVSCEILHLFKTQSRETNPSNYGGKRRNDDRGTEILDRPDLPKPDVAALQALGGLDVMFGKFGKVTDAVVVSDRDTGKSRGFGFVVMEDRKDAAKAIQELDGSELDGREIVVNLATERKR